MLLSYFALNLTRNLIQSFLKFNFIWNAIHATDLIMQFHKRNLITNFLSVKLKREKLKKLSLWHFPCSKF